MPHGMCRGYELMLGIALCQGGDSEPQSTRKLQFGSGSGTPPTVTHMNGATLSPKTMWYGVQRYLVTSRRCGGFAGPAHRKTGTCIQPKQGNGKAGAASLTVLVTH